MSAAYFCTCVGVPGGLGEDVEEQPAAQLSPIYRICSPFAVSSAWQTSQSKQEGPSYACLPSFLTYLTPTLARRCFRIGNSIFCLQHTSHLPRIRNWNGPFLPPSAVPTRDERSYVQYQRTNILRLRITTQR